MQKRFVMVVLFLCSCLPPAEAAMLLSEDVNFLEEEIGNASFFPGYAATGLKKIPSQPQPPEPLASPHLAVDHKLLNWINGNVSPRTAWPFSFYIPDAKKSAEYQKMGGTDSVPGILERMIVAEGFSIYDVAVREILLTMLGTPRSLEEAYRPLKTYWDGQFLELRNIRAGYPIQPYIYDPDDPEAVTSDILDKGRRGFIFRLLNANGLYNTRDPIDGKTHLAGFPNWPTVHWEDWKPIAGENAWVVMAAMQLYHKKYFDPSTRSYRPGEETVELLLAQELARAALLLQAENGGIRMAPLGTYYHLVGFRQTNSLEDIDRQLSDHFKKAKSLSYEQRNDWRQLLEAYAQEEYSWYYDAISTENNLSWYSAFRMLYQVTQDPRYAYAMQEIERYLQTVWNDKEKYFYQGAHFSDGRWVPSEEFFATDCQTWAITKVGPERLDALFGEGAAYRIWETARTGTGFRNGQEGELWGVGFTRENDRMSIEWTVGAVFAARELAAYYRDTHPDWARQAFSDEQSMRKGIETFRVELTDEKAAYPYSSKRGWIPFGWISHDQDVLSLASTCWVMLLDADFNPAYLPDQNPKTEFTDRKPHMKKGTRN